MAIKKTETNGWIEWKLEVDDVRELICKQLGISLDDSIVILDDYDDTVVAYSKDGTSWPDSVDD